MLNFDVEIEVPDTEATIESELKKFEYLSPLLKKKRLMPKRMARTKAILDFPKLLNIFIFYGVACIILVSRRESKYAWN